jgi:hypothetical protein
MSKIKLQGNATGTGTLTIEAPATDTDRSLTLPDNAGTVLTSDSDLPAANLTGTLPAIDGSALTGISSYADSDALSLFNASGSAPVFATRAWLSFQGASTPSVTASGNVSSVTENSTGVYNVNFATNMQDNGYAAATSTDRQYYSGRVSTHQTGYVRVAYTDGAGNNTPAYWDVIVVR